MPGAAVPPVNATGPAAAPADDRALSNREAAIHPTTVASARTELPVEVVAIRFRVIERTPSKWTWSWRLTIQGRGEAARANARIQFIEFQGSTSRVLGSEEVCGLRLAGKPLVFIEGIHTLSAEESQRVSAVTATFSKATRCGGVSERGRS
jgi:hypothetical protein